MTTAPATADQLAQVLAQISTKIDEQCTQMAAGALGELGDLGPLLTEMTTLLERLTPAEAKGCEAALAHVNNELGRASEAYKRQRDAAQTGMSQLSTRMRAATAYARSDHAAPPGPLTILPSVTDDDAKK